MDWEAFENALRKGAKDMQDQQLTIPASHVASTAAVGSAAIILIKLANAVAIGRSVAVTNGDQQ